MQSRLLPKLPSSSSPPTPSPPPSSQPAQVNTALASPPIQRVRVLLVRYRRCLPLRAALLTGVGSQHGARSDQKFQTDAVCRVKQLWLMYKVLNFFFFSMLHAEVNRQGQTKAKNTRHQIASKSLIHRLTLKTLNAWSALVSWCFEPSQPHRITSGLKTNFSLSISYSFNKS